MPHGREGGIRLRDAQNGVVGLRDAGAIDADESTVARRFGHHDALRFEDVDGSLDRLGRVVGEAAKFADRELLVGVIDQQPEEVVSGRVAEQVGAGAGIGISTETCCVLSAVPSCLAIRDMYRLTRQ